MSVFLLILFSLYPTDFQTKTISFSSENSISPHKQAIMLHRFDPQPQRIYPTFPTPDLKSLNTVVYGYLPYWISDLSNIRWNDLTHLAYFAIEVHSDGTLGDKHSWPDNTLVSQAHATGVNVDIVFTLFDSNNIATLLASSSSRNTLINNMINEMENGNADGINIDFEFVPSEARDNFTTFLTELRTELNTRGYTNATISFAGPTSVSSGLDFPAIFNILDYYFIMAYGYHWSGSTYAGPPGQFRVTETWSNAGSLSLLKTIALITKAVGENMRHKIIAGLPLYGREWTTNSSSWPSQVISHVGSVTYAAARTLLNEGKTRYFDEGICSPAIIWQEGGTWHQVWYEDEQSFACKYEMLKQEHIGGVGFWALGYDGSYSEMWDVLEEHFSNPYSPSLGEKGNPIIINSFPFADSKDTSTSGYRYFNYYSCNDSLAEYGREFVYKFNICTSGTFTAHINDDPNIDPDIHLLSDDLESACIDRAHTDLSIALSPGSYYLVIDTYVDSSSVELEGVYNLNADFAPDDPQFECPSGTTCIDGECVCENNLTLCGEICIDVTTDDQNCGSCGVKCTPSQSCTNGICTDNSTDSIDDTDDDISDASDVDDQDATSTPQCEECTTTYSCACQNGNRNISSDNIPFIFVIFLLLGIQRFLVFKGSKS